MDQWRVLGGPGVTVCRRLERGVMRGLVELVSENKSDTGPLVAKSENTGNYF